MELEVSETSMRDIKILILLKRFKQTLEKKNESTWSKHTDDDVELDNALPPRPKIPPIYLKIQNQVIFFFKKLNAKYIKNQTS